MRATYWGPIAGIAFAILFLAGLFLLNLPVGGEASPDEEIRAFYDDAANRQRIVIAAYVLAIAGLAFIIFLADLYVTLVAADGSPARLPTIVLVSGVAFVAMLFAGSAALASLGAGMALGGEPSTLGDTGVARFLAHAGYAMVLVYAALSAALMVLVTSVLGMRTKALPAWLNWLGIAVAVLLLAAIIFLPVVFLPVWVLAVSIALLLRRS